MSGFTKRKPTLFAQKGTIWISKRQKNFQARNPKSKTHSAKIFEGVNCS